MKSAPGPGALDSYLASDPFAEERVDESPRALPFIDEFVVRKPLNRLSCGEYYTIKNIA